MKNVLFIKDFLRQEHIVYAEIEPENETEIVNVLFPGRYLLKYCFILLKYKNNLETCDYNYRLFFLFQLFLILGCMITILSR